jgi:amidase
VHVEDVSRHVDVRVLAQAIAARTVSASEVVDGCLGRLRAVDEATNCVAVWNDERARADAAALDRVLARDGPVGPLHGVPFTVKDWIDVAGLPGNGGFMEARDRVPSRDATVVARLRAAGAVLVAKTTVQVDSELFGIVRNPRDPARSPGGSSSGEAAAVGGGASPVGVASDSGGSIRVPAAWCGAAALKPSAGLVPTTGHFPRVGERSDGRTQIGPVGASVRNLVEVLRVIPGPDGRDAGCAPAPFGDVDAVDVTALRVGWSCDEPGWSVSPAVRRAVERSVALLEHSGATVVGEVSPRLDEAFDVTQRYWARTRGTLAAADAQAHLVAWDRYRGRMLDAHHDVDVVVLPATASAAPLHRPMADDDYVFTLPASLTGAPAAVVPVAAEYRLPIAVQVVAHRWRDDVALRVAALLEAEAEAGSDEKSGLSGPESG